MQQSVPVFLRKKKQKSTTDVFSMGRGFSVSNFDRFLAKKMTYCRSSLFDSFVSWKSCKTHLGCLNLSKFSWEGWGEGGGLCHQTPQQDEPGVKQVDSLLYTLQEVQLIS